jgi:hypothetical protein
MRILLVDFVPVSRAQRSARIVLVLRCDPLTSSSAKAENPALMDRTAAPKALDPRFRGDDRTWWDTRTQHASPRSKIQLSNRQASSPVLFLEAPGRPVVFLSMRRRKRTEGARDARGLARTHGPRRLATSRHVESFKCRKSAKSQGVPRAVFVGLFRIAPGGLTVSGNPPSGSATSPPLFPRRPPAHF